jgi:hypothetical protein
MSKVVELVRRNEPKPDVWQCQCGHYSFWLYSTGQVVCEACETEAASMQGYWKIPTEPDTTNRELMGKNVHQLFPSSESDH